MGIVSADVLIQWINALKMFDRAPVWNIPSMLYSLRGDLKGGLLYEKRVNNERRGRRFHYQTQCRGEGHIDMSCRCHSQFSPYLPVSIYLSIYLSLLDLYFHKSISFHSLFPPPSPPTFFISWFLFRWFFWVCLFLFLSLLLGSGGKGLHLDALVLPFWLSGSASGSWEDFQPGIVADVTLFHLIFAIFFRDGITFFFLFFFEEGRRIAFQSVNSTLFLPLFLSFLPPPPYSSSAILSGIR